MNEPAEDAVVTALWSKVLEDFTNDAAHRGLIDHHRARGQLGEVARRYRAHRESLGEQAEPAVLAEIDRRLAAIAVLATAELDTARTPPGRHHGALRVALVIIALICTAVAAGMVSTWLR